MLVKKIALNAVWLLAGKVAAGLINIWTLALIARYLGVDEYGTYAYCLAFFLIFQIIAIFGLDTILIREIARESDQIPILLGQGIWLKTVMAALGFFIAIGTIWLVEGSWTHFKLVFIFSLSLFANAMGTPRVYFEAKLKAIYLVTVELFGKSLFLLLFLLGTNFSLSLTGLIWLFVLAEFATALAIFGLASRFVLPSFRFKFDVIRRLIASAFPVALNSIFVVIYFRMDTILLQFFKGSRDVGYYNAAYFVFAGLMFIPEAFSKSIFPVMAEVFHSASLSLSEIYHRSLKYMLTICLPTGLTGFMLAEEIIQLIYGESYAPAAGALKILSLAIVVMFLSYLVCTALFAMDRQRDVMWIALINAVVNIGMNIAWIPRWSYIATSASTVLTEGLGLFIGLLIVTRRIGFRILPASRFGFLPIVAALAVQFAIIRILQGNFLLLVLPTALLGYTVVLLTLKWLDETDWSILRKILQN